MNKLSIRDVPLLVDIRQLIDSARQRVAVAVNAELTALYWQIGRRINAEVLQGQRAGYGKQIVATLAQQLTSEYGKGWGEKQLWQCLRLAEVFADERILYTLCRELTWSHLRVLVAVDDSLKRDFYVQICRLEHWSVRQLQERMNSMLYERTAISKKPDDAIRNDLTALREEGLLSPDLAFRDPYFLDFLGLADNYAEKDIEAAIAHLAFDAIPQDPTRPEYRQGMTLGAAHKHWFRAKFFQQYRLFFRYHLPSKTLVLAWVNDEQSKRAYDSADDAYRVFRKMLTSGHPPDD